MYLPPLLADLGDLLQYLVVGVFVVIWVLSQVMGAGKKQPRRAQRPKQAPEPQRPQAQGQPQGGGGGGGLANEIDVFLREVKQQQQRPQPRPEPPRPQPQQLRPQPAQPQVGEQPLPSQRVVEAQLVEPSRPRKPSRPKPQPAAQQTSLSPQQPQQLGAEVAMADDYMDAHLEQVFDHQLGSLADTSDAIHEAPQEDAEGPQVAGIDVPVAATDIHGLLTGPENLRQAILLREILERPEQTW